jgi:hypothetical protein
MLPFDMSSRMVESLERGFPAMYPIPTLVRAAVKHLVPAPDAVAKHVTT